MPPPNVGMLFTPPLKDGKGVKAGVKEAARTLAGFYRRHVRLMSADLACRVARRLVRRERVLDGYFLDSTAPDEE